MATIFVWFPKNGNVGHASMALNNGTYISWWPTGTKSAAGTNHAAAMSISKDKAAEGGKGKPPKIPDYASAPIENLDEKSIEDWWLKISKRKPNEDHEMRQSARKIQGGGYDMISRNCSDLVLQALITGGMYSKYPLTFAMRGSNAIVSPLYIRDLAEAMTGTTGNKIKSLISNVNPIATTILRGSQYLYN